MDAASAFTPVIGAGSYKTGKRKRFRFGIKRVQSADFEMNRDDSADLNLSSDSFALSSPGSTRASSLSAKKQRYIDEAVRKSVEASESRLLEMERRNNELGRFLSQHDQRFGQLLGALKRLETQVEDASNSRSREFLVLAENLNHQTRQLWFALLGVVVLGLGLNSLSTRDVRRLVGLKFGSALKSADAMDAHDYSMLVASFLCALTFGYLFLEARQRWNTVRANRAEEAKLSSEVADESSSSSSSLSANKDDKRVRAEFRRRVSERSNSSFSSQRGQGRDSQRNLHCISPMSLGHNTSHAGNDDQNADFNEEYNMSHECWLNFFQGLGLRLEDVSYYQEMSVDQRITFQQFRKAFRKEFAANTQIDRREAYSLPDEFTILRFLQADKYNQKLAMKRLLSTVVWRQKINLPHLLANPPEKLEHYRGMRVRRFMGIDKCNRVVFAERTGQFVAQWAKRPGMSTQEAIDCYIYEMGQFICEMRKNAETGSGPATWKQTFICDAKGAGLQASFKAILLLRALSKEVEVHFPEMAGPILVVNCPRFVTRIWNNVKGFLDPTVEEKIQIFNEVPTDMLLNYVDKEVLFEEYGGLNKAEYPQLVPNSENDSVARTFF